MAEGTGQTNWLEVLAAEDRDAFRAELIPADGETWEQVLVKHRRAREWFGSDKVMAVTPTALCAYHGMMINLAVGRGELAHALATFDEMGTVAAPRADDPRVREIACRAGDELMQALVEAADLPAAEQIFAVLNQLATAYPDDTDVVSTAAATASYLVVGYCRRKDFESALACCNRINHLWINHLYGNEELQPEIDLWHARSVVNLILSLVESDAWDKARHIAHQRRDLLLSPASLEDLAATRGEELAASIRELLEAMIETYEATHPPAAPRGRDRILDQYDFGRLQTVSPFEFLSLRVPARWSHLQHENGDWGYWEEGVEAGTLWVNYRYLDLDAGPHGPSRDLLDQIVGDLAQSLVGDEERENVQTADAANGRLVRFRREGEEDGERLAYHQWFLLCPCGTGALLIQFSLVLLLDLARRPDFKELVDIMDREIISAEIEPGRVPTDG